MFKYFVITIGNETSILTLNRGKETLKYLFVDSIYDINSKEEIQKLFKKYSKEPIYIILDNIGQNYIRKKFPGISFFDTRSIANRKFNYEIPKGDLKQKRFLGRNKATNEWEYMFISSPIDDYLQEWLNIIESSQNILYGIYMLPLETENILKILYKKIYDKNKKKHPKWCILTLENQISNFREIIFQDGKLLFTRVLTFSEDNQSFIDEFKKNIIRTVDYLKRFSEKFDPEELVNFVFTDKNKKEVLESVDPEKIKVFSNLELGNFLEVKNFTKFQPANCDLIIQKFICHNRKVAVFSNKEMNSLKTVSATINFMKFIRIASVFLLLFSIGFNFFYTNKNKKKINNIKVEIKNKKFKVEESKRKSIKDSSINIDDVLDSVTVYGEITKSYISPFASIMTFSNMAQDLIIINMIKWKIKNFDKQILAEQIYKYNINIDGVIINKSGKIDDLFKVYDNFEKKIKETFSKANITLSSLPKNINFNISYFSFPIKIEISEK